MQLSSGHVQNIHGVVPPLQSKSWYSHPEQPPFCTWVETYIMKQEDNNDGC